VILSDEQIAEAERYARRFQGAWTKTSGTLASWIIHLVDTLEASMNDANRQDGESVAERFLDTVKETIVQRSATYGPPQEHFSRTVAAVNAIFSKKLREPLTTSDWASIMMLDKLARAQGSDTPNPDTTIDLAGYAACKASCEAQP
jgi:hypothetical protein